MSEAAWLADAQNGPYKVNSLILTGADALHGRVSWDPLRSLWNTGMLLTSLVLAPLLFSWGAFAAFLALLAFTMCTGHSVGFHRRLIHRTFQCPSWLERLLLWSGTLVGMQGPLWVIRSIVTLIPVNLRRSEAVAENKGRPDAVAGPTNHERSISKDAS